MNDVPEGPPYSEEEYAELAARYRNTGGRAPSAAERTALETPTLPAPDCRYGYTAIQLARILGPRLPTFQAWMAGQTQAICDGRTYNYDTGQYEPSGCGPHGVVAYPWDFNRFLAGQPIID